MKLEGACHCGAVRVTVPRKPRRLTSCNCSICRRTGALWMYFRRAEVGVVAARGATHSYVWGDKSLRLMRCANCGIVTHWEPMRPTADSRMGVNVRNFDPSIAATTRVRRFDGAATWKFLD